MENGKTIIEVSEILFKAYNTIKNWWQTFKKDGIHGLEIKKILGRPAKIKNKTLLEFMEAKTKEEQYVIPENIARDLKNEFGVDYSLSGMRNATHHINYTCKTMEPLHSNMQSIEDVLEWQHDMKRWFSRLKKIKSTFGAMTPPRSITISPVGSACGHRKNNAYLAIIVGTT